MGQGASPALNPNSMWIMIEKTNPNLSPLMKLFGFFAFGLHLARKPSSDDLHQTEKPLSKQGLFCLAKIYYYDTICIPQFLLISALWVFYERATYLVKTAMLL